MSECEHEYVFSDVYPSYAEAEEQRGKANPIRCYWVCEKCGEHGAVRFHCNHQKFMDIVGRFTRNYDSGLEWTVVDYAERWMADRPKRGNVYCHGFELGVWASIRDDLEAEIRRRIHARELERAERESTALLDEIDTRERSAVVYFIRNRDTGAVKIGTTGNITARLNALRLQGGLDLELLGTVSGGRDVEGGLHRLFAVHRVRGEWFNPAPEILDYIATNAQPMVGAA